MFGIVGCSNCGKKRIIDLTCDRTVCPHCGRSAETKNLRVLYKDDDQGNVRAAFSSITGFVPEKKERGDDPDPMSTLAYKVEHISDIHQKLSTIADGLDKIKGGFKLEDVEEIVPGKGEKYIKTMLHEMMIFEARPGIYKKM